MASTVLASQAAKGVPKHILRQSLFLAYCPDAEGVLKRRLEVRPKHFERVNQDKEAGTFFFGIGFLPPAGSPLFAHPALPAGAQPMDGSVMVYRQPNIEAMWARIKEDVYWTEGIWQHDKVVIHELVNHPDYVDMQA